MSGRVEWGRREAANSGGCDFHGCECKPAPFCNDFVDLVLMLDQSVGYPQTILGFCLIANFRNQFWGSEICSFSFISFSFLFIFLFFSFCFFSSSFLSFSFLSPFPGGGGSMVVVVVLVLLLLFLLLLLLLPLLVPDLVSRGSRKTWGSPLRLSNLNFPRPKLYVNQTHPNTWIICPKRFIYQDHQINQETM